MDRSDDRRVFAKVVQRGSFAGAAARRGAARLSIATSRPRHPASSPLPPGTEASACAGSVDARHRVRPAEAEELFTKAQESQYRPLHTEGVACKQPASAIGSRSCWPWWQRAVRCCGVRLSPRTQARR